MIPNRSISADGLAEEIINGPLQAPQGLCDRPEFQLYIQGKDGKGQASRPRRWGCGMCWKAVSSREGNRVRITAQLIDATTGNHVFSERYERELQDLFAIEDDITIKVVSAMRVNWTYGEQATYAWERNEES